MNAIRIISNELRCGHGSTGFELLLDNWGTMKEWGHTLQKRRPNLTDLIDICKRIGSYRAANYVNYSLLGREYHYIYFQFTLSCSQNFENC